jgi:hypothetical protein
MFPFWEDLVNVAGRFGNDGGALDVPPPNRNSNNAECYHIYMIVTNSISLLRDILDIS